MSFHNHAWWRSREVRIRLYNRPKSIHTTTSWYLAWALFQVVLLRQYDTWKRKLHAYHESASCSRQWERWSFAREELEHDDAHDLHVQWFLWYWGLKDPQITSFCTFRACRHLIDRTRCNRHQVGSYCFAKGQRAPYIVDPVSDCL